MAMLITLFLVLINIFNIVTTNSPNVEGMTAIAAWMLVCIFFVFGALGNQSLTHLTQSNNHLPNFPVPSVRSLLLFFLSGKYGTRIAFCLIWVHFSTPVANNCKASACYTKKKKLKEGAGRKSNL